MTEIKEDLKTMREWKQIDMILDHDKALKTLISYVRLLEKRITELEKKAKK